MGFLELPWLAARSAAAWWSLGDNMPKVNRVLTAAESGGAGRSTMVELGGVAVGSVPSSVRPPPSPLGVLEAVAHALRLANIGPAVDEVAEEDRLSLRAPVDALLPRVAEFLEEPFEGVSVPVDVADGVVHGFSIHEIGPDSAVGRPPEARPACPQVPPVRGGHAAARLLGSSGRLQVRVLRRPPPALLHGVPLLVLREFAEDQVGGVQTQIMGQQERERKDVGDLVADPDLERAVGQARLDLGVRLPEHGLLEFAGLNGQSSGHLPRRVELLPVAGLAEGEETLLEVVEGGHALRSTAESSQ
jgi:hypothetical protein